MKDKVLVLEKTVSEINIKLTFLENEIIDMKKENYAKEKADDRVNESKNTEDVTEVKTSVNEVLEKVKETSKDEKAAKPSNVMNISRNVINVTTNV